MLNSIFRNTNYLNSRTLILNYNFFILIWTLILIILCSVFKETYGNNDVSCQNLRATFVEKNWPADQVPRDPVNDDSLRICSKQSKTCCTPDIESFLHSQSRRSFDSSYKSAINRLGAILKPRAREFDEVFKKLISESKHDFDEMFKRTYGIIYEQNSYVFTDLFEELESYFSKGQVDLNDAMDNFFNTLYQKMFTVLNSQYVFDNKYLSCVGDHMPDLKPFGDVPQKLSVQIKRSFVATRTFAQGLNTISDVITTMSRLPPAGDCIESFMRMSHCSLCRGNTDARTCSNYCINVLKGCLAYHSELDTEWNNIIDAMDKVTDRLLGPFNIEFVVEPINIKISEAIMNFQENGQEVSQRVFSGCGKPSLGRRRRREARELELESLEFTRGNNNNNKQQQQQQQHSLEKLIKEIRVKLRDTKTFWNKLPYHICNDDKFTATAGRGSDEDDLCWNGTHVARYNRKIWGNGLGSQQSNPEVSLDTSRPNSLVNSQIFALKSMTSKLKNSYNGLDVDWIDAEDSNMETGSGEGSGDMNLEGSGGGRVGGHEDDDDEGGDDGDDTETPHVSTNDESNVITSHFIPKKPDHPIPGQPDTNNNVYTSNGATRPVGTSNRFSLAKALTSYLFPICVVWFGGMLSDWL